MLFLRATATVLALCLSGLAASGERPQAAHQVAGLATPLEASAFASLPTSAHIDAFLQALTAHSSSARLIPLGRSAGGRPLYAMCISPSPAFCRHGRSQPGKLSVLLLGSQHGTEPSGAEALQRVARELLHGSLQSYQATMDVVLIVNGNPDGRDMRRRVNAQDVNLSTDYVLLSQPESRAVVKVLHRFRPHVILDVHESALLKKRTLGAQGFLTDFEAQFETANNPNVEPSLRRWSHDHFLPSLLTAVNARGLPARHYIGEITDINQPITHGGLSPRTLRNYAGLLGSLSVLVENRLDPPGDYPSPRNIRSRVNKQFLSIATFLAQCQNDRTTILKRVQAARTAPSRSVPSQLSLVVSYAPHPEQPTISLPMRRRATGQLEQRVFDYHGRIRAGQRFTIPQTYYILAHHTDLAVLLDRHTIPYTRPQHPTQTQVIRQRIRAIQPPSEKDPLPRVSLSEQRETVMLSSASLQIDLDGPQARLVPLLLDPRSVSSVFRTPRYTKLLTPGMDFFVVRSAQQEEERNSVETDEKERHDHAASS